MQTCPPDVEGQNLLGEGYVPVVECGHQHVVLIMKDASVAISHELSVRASVGLGGVPQPGHERS